MSEPILVVVKSLQCKHCTQLSLKWNIIFEKIKKKYPTIRHYPLIIENLNSGFDINTSPKGLKNFIKWYPSIILIPGPLWNEAMKNLGDNNRITLMENEATKLFNGVYENNSLELEKDHSKMLDIYNPDHYLMWIEQCLNDENFKNKQYTDYDFDNNVPPTNKKNIIVENNHDYKNVNFKIISKKKQKH